MRDIQFLVHVVQLEADRVFVGGRNCRREVVLGDVLEVHGGGVPAFRATVQGILTCGRRMNRLDIGMTGELELVFQGVGRIAAGCELVGSGGEPAPQPVVLGMGEFHVKSL